MDVIEKNISSLVKTQFPSFYQEEGQVFIQFVTEYFKWLETKTDALDQIILPEISYVIITAGNSQVIGYNTFFTKYYKNGDKFAIITNTETNAYEVYIIKNVDSDTLITLSTVKLPNFSSEKSLYGTIANKANPLYYARRFLEIKDIDESLSEFIVYFKKKYLTGLQFDTKTDIRRLIKHSLDLYRSKGTERSVDLLFKAVFGVPANVYYPARDLFKLSDGQWFVPKYLEINLNEKAHLLTNKQVYGLRSGATAYVDCVVRKNVHEKLIDVLYVSSIVGEFEAGEKINSIENHLSIEDCPIFVGSLNEIDVDVYGTGAQFSNGEIIKIISNNGKDAKGKVTSTQDITGTVSITLEDGGYGYSPFTQLFVSDKILTISNVNLNDTSLIGKNYIYDFETVTQAYSSINYINSNGQFNIGQKIYTYKLNNTIDGTGTILDVTQSSTSSGILKVSVDSGDLDYPTIYTTGNAVSAELTLSNGYFNSTAYANVIGVTDSVSIIVNNVQGNFLTGEKIFQYTPVGVMIANGSFFDYGLSIGNQKKLNLINCMGTFIKPYAIVGETSLASANVVSTDISIGVKDINFTELIVHSNTAVNTSFLSVSNTFGLYSGLVLYNSSNLSVINTYKKVVINEVNANDSFITLTTGSAISTNGTAHVYFNQGGLFISSNLIPTVFNTSTSNGYISFVSEGALASATLANSLIYSESVYFNTDFIKDYTTKNLNAVSWGFPGNTSYNYTSTGSIYQALTLTPIDIGKISYIASVNPGEGYTAAPLIRAYDPLTFPRRKNDELFLYVTGVSGSFINGEEVVQVASKENISANARGIIIDHSNSQYLVVKNLRYNSSNNFGTSNSLNATTFIKGKTSGSEAKITTVYVSDFPSYMGFDAKFNVKLQSYTGAITGVKVLDSGFGYINDETVTLEKLENSLYSGVGLARLKTIGTGTGFYRQNGGFLSSDKKIFDAYYYQEYSYEVRSSLILDKYSKMLKDVLHVAGTKMFGALVYDTAVSRASNIIVEKNYHNSCVFPVVDYEKLTTFYNDDSCFPFDDYNSVFSSKYDCESTKVECINTHIDLEKNSNFSNNQIKMINYDCNIQTDSVDLNEI